MTKNSYQFLDNPSLSPSTTRFWLIRHAIVNQEDRQYLYGSMDVSLCPDHIKKQQNIYHYLAKRLPKTKIWLATSLSRTQETAHLIQQAGYGHYPLQINDFFLEQSLGDWQGQTHEAICKYCQYPPHPFWPFRAKERPPNGENMYDVIQRVGPTLKELATIHHGKDVIMVSHGGSIRAAIAYSLKIPLNSALSLSILNLSLTILEKNNDNWRVLTINEYPSI